MPPTTEMRSASAALRELPKYLLMGAVRAYRLLLSPWLGSSCRFEPTCSAFSLLALEKHGAAAGTYLTLHRLVRCHPLCVGGHDPVPDRAMRLFPWATGNGPRTGTLSSPTPKNKTSP